MPQKTNLNISPYYDDFSKDNQFYRVLFNPGRPVQAREISTIQSILQDQIETFGSHMFKEGSMVIPGNTSYDYEYYSLKLNSDHLGTPVSLYVENLRQFLSTLFNISLFPEEIYFLSTMPSEINPTSILLISLCSIIITIIVSIFPALKAAKLDPVKALKYE